MKKTESALELHNRIGEMFLADTDRHELEIVKDEGLYRHLRYGRPYSKVMRFDIVTWPGYLAYAGDMGSFVFSRTRDMMGFFRGQRVNPEYWSQKVQASDRDGIREWSPGLFVERAREKFDSFTEDMDVGARAEAEERFAEEILCGFDDKSREMAYSDMLNFEYSGRHPFQDFYEVDTDVFTLRFLWCCHAIVKAVELYDAQQNLPQLRSDT